MIKKIDWIYCNTAIKDTRGFMDEKSIKQAMQEFGDWCVEQQKINDKQEYRYVWLNILTGEFSNSWDEKTQKEHNPVAKISPYVGTHWKLIKFQCLNEPNFEFTKYMKLR